MGRSFRRPLAVVCVSALVTGGFVWGRALGAHPHRQSKLQLNNWTRMLSANSADFLNAGGFQRGGQHIPPAEVFETVLDHVQREFVDGTESDARMTQGALSRMLASLDDPRTAYLEPTLCRARQDALLGKYRGIGAVLSIVRNKIGDIDYRHVTVVDVAQNSPAEKAGLKTGDRITEIDGRWVMSYSVRVEIERLQKEFKDRAPEDPQLKKEADRIQNKFSRSYVYSKALLALLTGEGKTLKLAIERPGEAAPLKVELTTALTDVDPVRYRAIKPGVGYLQVRQFNGQATSSFEEALDNLPATTRGLIVDLRQNPGGVTAEEKSELDGYRSALRLLSRLTPGGVVAMLERRPNQREPIKLPVSENGKWKLAVLVDRGTANISELVAAALRDAGKARVIGSRTFGDPVLQLFTVLKNRGGVEMTSAHLFTTAGVELSKGIEPDVVVATKPGSDAALDSAVAEVSAGA